MNFQFMRGSASIFPASRFRRFLLSGIAATGLLLALLLLQPKKPSVLRVGYTDFAPFVIPAEGHAPGGLASELVRRAADRARIRLEWIKVRGSIDEAFRSGTIDLYPLLTITDTRRSQLYFSEPWWIDEIGLVSLEACPMRVASDTRGKRIAIRGMGVLRNRAAQLFPEARLITIPQMERMPAAVCRGEIDGFFLDVGLVQSQLLKGQPDCSQTPLHVASIPGSSFALATAASRSKSALAARLYDRLLDLAFDGTLSTLASQWSLYNSYDSRRLKETLEGRERNAILRYGAITMGVIAFIFWAQWRRIRVAHRSTEAARSIAEDSQQRFDEFMKHTPALTYIKDEEGRYLFINDTMCQQFDRSAADTRGKTDFDLWPPEIAAALRNNDWQVLAQNASRELIETLSDPAGRAHHFLTLKFPFINRNGQKFLGGVSVDITERRRAEEALRFSQFSIDRSPDAIIWLDDAARIFYVNDSACRQLGYTRDEMIGMPLQRINPSYTWDEFVKGREELRKVGSKTFETIHYTSFGRTFPVEVTSNLLAVEGREFTCCMSRDISERKQAERVLAHQARHDVLTGLPNRRALEQQLAAQLEKCASGSDVVAVACLDLDGFKLVNDTLGHVFGDKLLVQVASRLGAHIRTNDTLARLGDDEFAIIMPGLTSASEVSGIAQRLLAALQEGFHIGGHDLVVTATVGISMFPRDGVDVAGLLQNADAAMYEAKKRGKNRVQSFTPEMVQAARERLELENHLRRALDRTELSVHYQPQIAPSTGHIERFEALLRWKHPVLGEVPPLQFIPVAEETGLIVPIGNWVLEEACRQAQRWQENGAGKKVGVGVNVSPIQFMRQDFVDTVIAILERSGLPPRLLDLEITETAVMHGIEEVSAKIAQLRDMGISISIDDFGTGYSSLNYLQKLPIDSLKIDRSFLRDMATDPDAVSLTHALVTLAHSLGFRVVIEGIETRQQLDAVQRIGGDLAQGYLLGRPQPVTEALLIGQGAVAA